MLPTANSSNSQLQLCSTFQQNTQQHLTLSYKNKNVGRPRIIDKYFEKISKKRFKNIIIDTHKAQEFCPTIQLH